MSEARIILTPECQDLWLLSPSLLLIYDKIVMDKRDLDRILNPAQDSQFSFMKFKCAEKLIKWGFLETVNYEQLLTIEERRNITLFSKNLIKKFLIVSNDKFDNSEFYKLALHTHRKYASFLEQSIIACPLDDKTQLNNLNRRLDAINERIKKLEAKELSDDFLDKIKRTLERIASKALAGIIVAKGFGLKRLYDTDEYKPFINHITKDNIFESGDMSDDNKNTIFPVVISALSGKPLPDISIFDEYNFFLSVREKSEFIKIRKILKDLEDTFEELNISTYNELLRKKLMTEFEKLKKALIKRLLN